MSQVGRLPVRGELVQGPEGFEIEVLDSDPRRIKKVRIHSRRNQRIERDREGRRRYSTSDPTVGPAPALSPEAAPDDTAKAPQQPAAPSTPSKS